MSRVGHAAALVAAPPARPGAAAAPPPRRLVEAAFLLCNGARVFAYLPTLWAMHSSGDSSQHSLWTWATWLAANLTMAMWLVERDRGRPRLDRAVLISLLNGLMCLAAVLLILRLRA